MWSKCIITLWVAVSIYHVNNIHINRYVYFTCKVYMRANFGCGAWLYEFEWVCARVLATATTERTIKKHRKKVNEKEWERERCEKNSSPVQTASASCGARLQNLNESFSFHTIIIFHLKNGFCAIIFFFLLSFLLYFSSSLYPSLSISCNLIPTLQHNFHFRFCIRQHNNRTSIKLVSTRYHL